MVLYNIKFFVKLPEYANEIELFCFGNYWIHSRTNLIELSVTYVLYFLNCKETTKYTVYFL